MHFLSHRALIFICRDHGHHHFPKCLAHGFHQRPLHIPRRNKHTHRFWKRIMVSPVGIKNHRGCLLINFGWAVESSENMTTFMGTTQLDRWEERSLDQQ